MRAVRRTLAGLPGTTRRPSPVVPVRVLLLLAALLPAALSAQVRPVSVAVPIGNAATRAATPAVPVHLLPPAGKCRIWLDSVPAARQPAPTDCATALRQKPANGVILYGPVADDEARGFDRDGDERPAPPAASAAAPAKTGGAKRPPDRPEARKP